MGNQIELKPCPFCGGAAEAYSDFSCVYERISGFVKCKNCGIKKYGDVSFNTYAASYEGYDTPEWVANAHEKAKESAIKMWNRRAGDTD